MTVTCFVTGFSLSVKHEIKISSKFGSPLFIDGETTHPDRPRIVTVS